MARGPQIWTEELIERRQLEGRGKGVKEQYVPWIDYNDFSPKSNIHRFTGAYINRPHLLLSDLEFNAFTLAEWCLKYSDIREQMPLERSLTTDIAEALGITHSTYPGTRIPVVMTTDILLTDATNESRQIALNVKCPSDLQDERKVALLEIQRYYYDAMGIPHLLYVETEAGRLMAQTIQWARAALPDPAEPKKEPYPGCNAEHILRLESELAAANSDVSLLEYCRHYDQKNRLTADTALGLARTLIFTRRLDIPMDSREPALTPLFSVSRPMTQLEP